MFFRVKGFFKYLPLILVLSINTIYAGAWYKIHTDSSFAKINDAVSLDMNPQRLFSAGDEGRVYQSIDGGYSWMVDETGTVEHLYAIDFGAEVEGDSALVVAGENGLILRRSIQESAWTLIDTLGSLPFNAVYYYQTESNFWIGGDGSVVYYSNDYGKKWYTAGVAVSGLSIREIVGGPDGLYLTGVKNDTTFILIKSALAYSFSPVYGDTIPGFKVNSAAFIQNGSDNFDLYLAGNSAFGGNGMVYEKMHDGEVLGPAMVINSNISGGVVDFNGVFDDEMIMSFFWISTAAGEVWESTDRGNIWSVIYRNKETNSLGPVLGFENGYDRGRIWGENGLVLRYGFELLNHKPHQNEQVRNEFDHIELEFSGIPEIDSISSGVYISNSISGSVPFTAEYHLDDSLKVNLFPSRQFINNTIPGEKWNVSLSDKITQKGVTYYQPFREFNYNFDIMPWPGSGFDFGPWETISSSNATATNMISGMFNEDDTFDFILFSQDTLYCYTADDSGKYTDNTKIPLPGTIAVEPDMEEQLFSADVNIDGKPDLFLYDHSSIYILLNQSEEAGFQFSAPTAQYNSQNINQVSPFNANHNQYTDLVILNDSLLAIHDVRWNNFSGNKFLIENPSANYGKIRAADFDLDGWKDLVLLNSSGRLFFYRSQQSGYFDAPVSSSGSGYLNMRIADIDGNHDPELIATSSHQIDAYTLDRQQGWNFYVNELFTFNSDVHQSIADFILHDFGGGEIMQYQSRMDLALVTADTLKILENTTSEMYNYSYSEQIQSHRALDLTVYGILQADFSKDGLPDLNVFNSQNGSFQLLEKKAWRPVISNVSVNKHLVSFEWTQLPAEVGAIEYYRVMRDSSADFNYHTQEWSIAENHFTDTNLYKAESFYYTVYAVYSGGTTSAMADPAYVENFYDINGDISGILDDTTRYYVARSVLNVPQGQSLQIRPGVEIQFDSQTALSVFGNLEAIGDGIDNRMVEFSGMHYGGPSWDGIRLQPGVDTVKFEWFSISGAETGIASLDRPLRMHFGGISHNDVGMHFNGDTLSMFNVILDSNMTAINISGSARAEIRNVNVVDNIGGGIYTWGSSNTTIRNSLLGGNGGPAVQSNVGADMLYVSYSTVEELVGPMTTYEISNVPPVFMPNDSGYYRIDPSSPTIDAGDPRDDFSMEPQPNGYRVNQGLFGGSWMATPTSHPRIYSHIRTVFLETAVGQTDSSVLDIKNVGADNLIINNIMLLSNFPDFEVVNPGPATLVPGDSLPVTIRFTPQSRMEIVDTLLFVSNDNRSFYSHYKVVLKGRGANSPPVISGQPVRAAEPGELYSYQINASDADGDTLSFTANELPPWLNLSAGGLLIGTPAESDIGLNKVNVDISDPYGGMAELDYFIFVAGDSSAIKAPSVILKPLPRLNLKQASVRFEFFIVDSSNADYSCEGCRILYFLHNKALDDIPMPIDTADISELIFYPLYDGEYLFKIWAYDTAGNGYAGEKARSVDFSVEASRRKLARQRWYMASFPRAQSINWNQFEYTDSSAILLEWDNNEQEYKPLTRTNILPGTGFWIMPMDTMSIDISFIDHLPPDNPQGVDLSNEIVEGWNQVGIPVGYGTAWKDMFFITEGTEEEVPLVAAAEMGYIEGGVHWFQQIGKVQGYNLVILDTFAISYPWLGYWLKANQPGMIRFSTEAAFQKDAIADNPADFLARRGIDWRLNISLKNAKYVDETNVLGMRSRGIKSIHEPPHFGEYCSFSFESETGALALQYQQPFDSFDEVKIWETQVRSTSGLIEHNLSWENESMNSGLALYLVDRQKELVINMHETSGYSFLPGDDTYRFKIYVSQDQSFKPQIVPLTYRLKQNFPNPFNPATTIRFGVPENGDKHVVIKVYDLLGREVTTLIEGEMEPGYHNARWNGINGRGGRAASGVYFYRLESAGANLVKKMILLR